MNTLTICHRNHYLKVVCEPAVEVELRKHFCDEMFFDVLESTTPDFTLIIGAPGYGDDCICFQHHNDFFHGAEMTCWISNTQRCCWIDALSAPTQTDAMLCLRYFCSNVFNRLLELDGYLGIHSSCVVYRGMGVVFIGDRLAGKTTSMLTLIDAGFDLVCNDESAMKYNAQEDRIDVFGIHNDVYIRMREHLCRQRFGKKYQSIASQQGIEIVNSAGISENRIIVSHKQLSALNNVALLPATCADLVILPQYSPGLSTARFTTVGEEESVPYLLGQETELIHDSTLFLYEMCLPNCMAGNLRELVRSLARRPCYRCEYNENTAQDFINQIKYLCRCLQL